ncbi:hypothetical protein ACLOJK_016435 [Asimina triloba]
MAARQVSQRGLVCSLQSLHRDPSCTIADPLRGKCRNVDWFGSAAKALSCTSAYRGQQKTKCAINQFIQFAAVCIHRALHSHPNNQSCSHLYGTMISRNRLDASDCTKEWPWPTPPRAFRHVNRGVRERGIRVRRQASIHSEKRIGAAQNPLSF